MLWGYHSYRCLHRCKHFSEQATRQNPRFFSTERLLTDNGQRRCFFFSFQQSLPKTSSLGKEMRTGVTTKG